MRMIPVRLPDEMAETLDRVASRGGLDRFTALRRLVAAGLGRYVAGRYRRGELSLREAAAWMGVDVREAMDRPTGLGVAGNITGAEAQAALDLIRSLPRE